MHLHIQFYLAPDIVDRVQNSVQQLEWLTTSNLNQEGTTEWIQKKGSNENQCQSSTCTFFHFFKRQTKPPKKLTTLPIPASAPLPNCASKELNGATTLLNPMVNFTTCTLKANKHFRKWLPSAYESFLQPTGFLQCHSSKHQHLAWPSGMGPQSF